MKTLMRVLAWILVVCGWAAWAQPIALPKPFAMNEAAQPKGSITFAEAQLLRSEKTIDMVSEVEAAYIRQAKAARRVNQAAGQSDRNSQPTGGKDKIGQKPLTEMSADDRYKEQDGGLYGGGKNEPPEEHRMSATAELAKIKPLDNAGRPAENGTIGFVSISMSNATQEFSMFKRLADADSAKSTSVTIVDCAQGGQAMAEWVDPLARPWQEAARRVAMADIVRAQVQVAWIKLANKGPHGDLLEHGKKLEKDTLAVIQNAKAKFPNLRVAYLSSRIYGGYSTGALNPEPYAYESAFVVRWLIQRQINGDKALNYDAGRGEVRAPILLWGPYLWADGVTPRKVDGLTYGREDLASDGTHPSEAGREKVAKLMLDFFKGDPLSKSWFDK